MTLTHAMVDHAEDMSSAYDEAMSSIRNAIDVLKSVKDCTAGEFADALTEILSEMEDDNEQFEAILSESDRQENEALLRDYWRAVI